LSTGTWNELENIGNVGAWDELGVAAYIDGIGEYILVTQEPEMNLVPPHI